MATEKRTANRVPTIVLVSNADNVTPINWLIDPTTGRALVNATITGAVGPFSSLADITEGQATCQNTTANQEVIAAPGVGFRLYITSFSISNGSGSDTWVNIKNGTTTKVSFYTAQAGGGASYPMATPLRLDENTALNVATESSVDQVRVSAQGFTDAV